MSKASKKVKIDPGEIDPPVQTPDRSKQLLDREDVREALQDKFTEIINGYDKQADRADDIMDWWDVYNCILGQKQAYNGNAQIFVPIVHSAIEARKTRFERLGRKSERCHCKPASARGCSCKRP